MKNEKEFKDMVKQECDTMAKENNEKWCQLSLYLENEVDEGKTEFRMVVNPHNKTFYIHPMGKDGISYDGKL